MGAEGNGILAELAQFRQRHHLEAAGVRQNRALPSREFLQAAKGGDPLGARAQHQGIGVAERDVGAGLAALAQCTPFMAPAVPTGMKAGVRTTPCGVVRRPVRAAPSVASSSKWLERLMAGLLRY